MSEAHITLYSDSADRFEEIQDALEAQHGMPYGNAETVKWLMAHADVPGEAVPARRN